MSGVVAGIVTVTTVPLAHFGHVLVDLPIFFGPVFALTVWILIVTRRDRRRQRRR